MSITTIINVFTKGIILNLGYKGLNGRIAFALTKNKIKLFDKDRFISMNTSHWWKNKISI